MTCSKILPNLTIQAASISEITNALFLAGGINSAAIAPFLDPASPVSSFEYYRMKLGFEAQINIEEFLGRFSLSEVFKATSDAPSPFTARVILTNNPQLNKLTLELINTIQQVSVYLYNNTQTPTAKEVQEIINDPPLNIPSKLEDAIFDLDKCIKILQQSLASEEEPPEEEDSEVAEKKQTLDFIERGTSSSESPTTADSFTQKILNSLCDNSFLGLAPRIDVGTSASKIIAAQGFGINAYPQVVLPFGSETSNAESYGFPPKAKAIQNAGDILRFAVQELKDLYITIVPAFEYRESGKLLFSVRDFYNVPLIEDFNKTQFFRNLIPDLPTAVNEQNSTEPSTLEETTLDYLGLPESATGVEVYNRLLKSRTTVDIDVAQNINFISAPPINLTKQVLQEYGSVASKAVAANTAKEKIVAGPYVSVGYGKEVNGMFFINRKKLLKSVSSFSGMVEKPELFASSLLKVQIEKVLDNGKVEFVSNPTVLNGKNLEPMEFNNGAVVGYYFTDIYDPRNFEYRITATVKNPLATVIEYVMPKLQVGISNLDVVIFSYETDPESIEVNPLTGFFTDEYLSSDFYKQDQLTYNYYRKLLFNILDNLLPGEDLTKGLVQEDRTLTNAKQFSNLKKLYDTLYEFLQKVASTEKITITNSYNNTKTSTSAGATPTTNIEFFSVKPYTYSESSVFYDYINSQITPDNSGFFVNPESLKERINIEQIILNSYGETKETLSYESQDPISLSPLGIDIDSVRTNLGTIQDNAEDIVTRALLSAELEFKTPERVFTSSADVISELLNLQNTTIVLPEDKTLTALPPDDNFVPNDLSSAAPASKLGKTLIKYLKQLKQQEKDKNTAAAQEMAQENLSAITKRLFLDVATYNWQFLKSKLQYKLRPLPRLQKIAEKTNQATDALPKIDQKHGDLALLLGEAEFVQRPATYFTRFANSLQLQYLANFDDNMEPIFLELNLDEIERFIPPVVFMDNRLIRITAQAGFFPDFGGVYNEYFLLSRTAEPSTFPPLQPLFAENGVVWSSIIGADVSAPPAPTRGRLTRNRLKQNVRRQEPSRESTDQRRFELEET